MRHVTTTCIKYIYWKLLISYSGREKILTKKKTNVLSDLYDRNYKYTECAPPHFLYVILKIKMVFSFLSFSLCLNKTYTAVLYA